SSLEDLCAAFSKKISDLKKTFQLKNIGKSQGQPVFFKIMGEMSVLHNYLDEMEAEVKEQEKLKNFLKGLQKAAKSYQGEAQHLQENIPPNLPKETRSCTTEITVKCEEKLADVKEPECAKKTLKTVKQLNSVKEIPLVTAEEFQSVPGYMKGRLKCTQINEVVQEINKAVVSKYKIFHQPLKTLNQRLRSRYSRFWEEETKETTGLFFVVDEDIKEFTKLKVDKQFHKILTILRHCHRVRHIQDSRAVRYVIC
ncbi:SKA1 protein, partial [Zapornia atra]|nr:SKA1 protein [Zapornia atra]